MFKLALLAVWTLVVQNVLSSDLEYEEDTKKYYRMLEEFGMLDVIQGIEQAQEVNEVADVHRHVFSTNKNGSVSYYDNEGSNDEPAEYDEEGDNQEPEEPAEYDDALPLLSAWGDYLIFNNRRNRIGGGQSGEVYNAIRLSDGKDIAVKVIKLNKYDGHVQINKPEDIENELKMGMELSPEHLHPYQGNIVKTFAGLIDTDNSEAYLFMEKMSGDLSKFLYKDILIEDMPTLSAILRQVLQGLSFMHSLGFVHRDFKTENIMFNGSGEVKIMDFGLARKKEDLRIAQEGLAGSVLFMSPETVWMRPVDEKVDIWAVGILAIELMTGHTPFENDDKFETIRRIRAFKNPESTVHSIEDPQLQDFLRLTLSLHPKDRPSADELLKHDFIAKSKRYDMSKLIENIESKATVSLRNSSLSLSMSGSGSLGLAGSYRRRHATVHLSKNKLEAILKRSKSAPHARLIEKVVSSRTSSLPVHEKIRVPITPSAIGAPLDHQFITDLRSPLSEMRKKKKKYAANLEDTPKAEDLDLESELKQICEQNRALDYLKFTQNHPEFDASMDDQYCLRVCTDPMFLIYLLNTDNIFLALEIAIRSETNSLELFTTGYEFLEKNFMVDDNIAEIDKLAILAIQLKNQDVYEFLDSKIEFSDGIIERAQLAFANETLSEESDANSDNLDLKAETVEEEPLTSETVEIEPITSEAVEKEPITLTVHGESEEPQKNIISSDMKHVVDSKDDNPADNLVALNEACKKKDLELLDQLVSKSSPDTLAQVMSMHSQSFKSIPLFAKMASSANFIAQENLAEAYAKYPIMIPEETLSNLKVIDMLKTGKFDDLKTLLRQNPRCLEKPIIQINILLEILKNPGNVELKEKLDEFRASLDDNTEYDIGAIVDSFDHKPCLFPSYSMVLDYIVSKEQWRAAWDLIKSGTRPQDPKTMLKLVNHLTPEEKEERFNFYKSQNNDFVLHYLKT